MTGSAFARGRAQVVYRPEMSLARGPETTLDAADDGMYVRGVSAARAEPDVS